MSSLASSPVLRYPGAKWMLAKWIVSNLPDHRVYLEPFFGSGAVFFAKQPSHTETINDIDGDIVNLFRVIRERPYQLMRLIALTPWSRSEYYLSYEKTGDNIEDARRFLVRCWQAYGSKIGQKAGWKSDVQGKQSLTISKVWKKLPDRIASIIDRLRDAQIECENALKLIKRYAYSDVLIYADPPYPLSTRSSGLYRYEMSDDEHVELLDILRKHPGPVIISGYRCDLYDSLLSDWKCITRIVRANIGYREEVLWLNSVAVRLQQK